MATRSIAQSKHSTAAALLSDTTLGRRCAANSGGSERPCIARAEQSIAWQRRLAQHWHCLAAPIAGLAPLSDGEDWHSMAWALLCAATQGLSFVRRRRGRAWRSSGAAWRSSGTAQHGGATAPQSLAGQRHSEVLRRFASAPHCQSSRRRSNVRSCIGTAQNGIGKALLHSAERRHSAARLRHGLDTHGTAAAWHGTARAVPRTVMQWHGTGRRCNAQAKRRWLR